MSDSPSRHDKPGPSLPGEGFVPDVLAWWRGGFRGEQRAWLRVLRYYGAWLPLALAALGVAAWVALEPLPPRQVLMSTGQPGSVYHALSTKFAEHFRRHGIELVLVPTAGLDQGVRAIDDTNDRIAAGFMMAGSAAPGQYPELVSLGSQQYAPAWLFYRGPAPDGHDPLAGLLQRRMAVGLPDSNSRRLLEQLLALHGHKLPPATAQAYGLAHDEAATRFERGELDAVFIVDGFESPVVQRLLAVPGRGIVEFGLIEAYAKKLPFLDIVTLPRGSVDVSAPFPARDLRLLTTTVTLVVQQDLHPAIQWLFLHAARRIGLEHGAFFARADQFPRYIDQRVALSDVGARYFERGIPVLFEYLPLWLATLIDRLGALFVAAAAALALLLRLLDWRDWPSNKWLQAHWSALRDLEREVGRAATPAAADALAARLEALQSATAEMWIDDAASHIHYALRRTIADVRAQALARAAALRAAARSPEAPDQRCAAAEIQYNE